MMKRVIIHETTAAAIKAAGNPGPDWNSTVISVPGQPGWVTIELDEQNIARLKEIEADPDQAIRKALGLPPLGA